MSAPVCTVTHGGGDLGPVERCTLPQGHDGYHRGGASVWWHGNGEECPPECPTCRTKARWDALR